MNNARRKQLKDAIGLLEKAHENIEDARIIIESVRDEEQDAYDNLPESLQEGEKGEAINECIDQLDEVFYEVDDMYGTLDDQIEALNEVIG